MGCLITTTFWNGCENCLLLCKLETSPMQLLSWQCQISQEVTRRYTMGEWEEIQATRSLYQIWHCIRVLGSQGYVVEKAAQIHWRKCPSCCCANGKRCRTWCDVFYAALLQFVANWNCMVNCERRSQSAIYYWDFQKRSCAVEGCFQQASFNLILFKAASTRQTTSWENYMLISLALKKWMNQKMIPTILRLIPLLMKMRVAIVKTPFSANSKICTPNYGGHPTFVFAWSRIALH